MSYANVQFSVAAHMMTALGFHYGKEVTSGSLAESVRADPSFTRRTLSKLKKAGLVKTTRGRNGACVLAKSPDKITMLDIYRASQAPVTFAIHAYPVEKTCPVSSSIKGLMTDILDTAQADFEASLSRRTLASVVSGVPKS